MKFFWYCCWTPDTCFFCCLKDVCLFALFMGPLLLVICYFEMLRFFVELLLELLTFEPNPAAWRELPMNPLIC